MCTTDESGLGRTILGRKKEKLYYGDKYRRADAEQGKGKKRTTRANPFASVRYSILVSEERAAEAVISRNIPPQTLVFLTVISARWQCG